MSKDTATWESRDGAGDRGKRVWLTKIMSKNPAFQFYPSDWQRDLDDHPLEIEGAWIRICSRLYWTEGTATKTLEEWSRILRKNRKKTQVILHYLADKQIADLLNQNGNITITCRRMVRDANIRRIRKEAGIKGGNPILMGEKSDEVCLTKSEAKRKQTVKQSSTPSSSIFKDTNTLVVSGANNGCPHQEIISLYHDILPILPRVRQWTPKRQKMLKARWLSSKEYQDLDWWKQFFEYIRERCPHLLGKNDRQWTADLEWIVKEENFVKTVEGRYVK